MDKCKDLIKITFFIDLEAAVKMTDESKADEWTAQNKVYVVVVTKHTYMGNKHIIISKATRTEHFETSGSTLNRPQIYTNCSIKSFKRIFKFYNLKPTINYYDNVSFKNLIDRGWHH